MSSTRVFPNRHFFASEANHLSIYFKILQVRTENYVSIETDILLGGPRKNMEACLLYYEVFRALVLLALQSPCAEIKNDVYELCTKHFGQWKRIFRGRICNSMELCLRIVL